MSSICALIIGILLVVWPGEAAVYLVITIGVLFLLPGIYGLISYFIHPKSQVENQKTYFPVVALGSTLLGLWLIVMPGFFISILMYVLGVLILLGGLNLLVGLWNQRAAANVPVYLFIIPVLVIVAGLVVLFNPFQAATIPFIIMGVTSIVYSITDLIRLWRMRKLMNRNITDVKVLEEIKDE
ncbi:HdeD family acid-resistance protein [uncultured Bacteroides sp.]|uniref:HdeD family acid-resistance protein n=1 Tax=uncultured Bacteroides sp. TaxID=162156 RepID=UPI00260AC9D1|nr:DUF308 domain-containing protein [uncultured Bacteroides sp.]